MYVYVCNLNHCVVHLKHDIVNQLYIYIKRVCVYVYNLNHHAVYLKHDTVNQLYYI